MFQKCKYTEILAPLISIRLVIKDPLLKLNTLTNNSPQRSDIKSHMQGPAEVTPA